MGGTSGQLVIANPDVETNRDDSARTSSYFWRERRLEALRTRPMDGILQGNLRACEARIKELEARIVAIQAVHAHLEAGRELMRELRESLGSAEEILEIVATDAENNLRRHPEVYPPLNLALPEGHIRDIRMWPRPGEPWTRADPIAKVGVSQPGGGEIDWEIFPLRYSTHYPNAHYAKAGYDFHLDPGERVSHRLNIVMELEPCMAAIICTIPLHLEHESLPTVRPEYHLGKTPSKGLELRVHNRSDKTIKIAQGDNIALFFYVKLLPVDLDLRYISNPNIVADDSDEDASEDESDEPSLDENDVSRSGTPSPDTPPRTPRTATPAPSATSMSAVTDSDFDSRDSSDAYQESTDQEITDTVDPSFGNLHHVNENDTEPMEGIERRPQLVNGNALYLEGSHNLVESFDRACERAHRSGKTFDTRWPLHRQPRASQP